MSMNTDWTSIDDYFSNRLPTEERTRFEGLLRTDPSLAEAAAFYLTARQTILQEHQQQRKAELLARPIQHRNPSPAWPFAVAAAACLALLLGIGWVLWFQRPDPAQLADDYINRNLMQVSMTMGDGADSLQQGLTLLNEGKLSEADAWLTRLLNRQPGNADALKWAGVVALRQGEYNRAITQFSQLGRRTDLYANPGLFYEALSRIKRNAPDDKNKAKDLLQTVVRMNLEGSVEASRLLEQLD